MTKTISQSKAYFFCTECGGELSKWAGQCPLCNEWNTVVMEEGRAISGKAVGRPTVSPVSLASLTVEDLRRHATGLGEFDRVIGGGFVPGSLVLLGGDPGIGKSTMALNVAELCGSKENPALYCSGEESPSQIALRARRITIGLDNIHVCAETLLGNIVNLIMTLKPPLAVIDSVQTLYSDSSTGSPGSPSQVREAVGILLACAKDTGVPILLIGHVTKEGAIAGPRTLEHMVDVVLYLEGERHGEYRLLHGVKNRFGTTGELGVFAMTESGVKQLVGSKRAFFDDCAQGVAGNAITVMCEGIRPLAVEVQALTVPTVFGLPRRTTSGFDVGRLHVLLAVLEKRAHCALGQMDVYVNVAGGIRLNEPTGDLAVSLAIVSSLRDIPLPKYSVAMGEIGLGGEIRQVRHLESRLNEAENLGMVTGLIPAQGSEQLMTKLKCISLSTICDAVKLLE